MDSVLDDAIHVLRQERARTAARLAMLDLRLAAAEARSGGDDPRLRIAEAEDAAALRHAARLRAAARAR